MAPDRPSLIAHPSINHRATDGPHIAVRPGTKRGDQQTGLRLRSSPAAATDGSKGSRSQGIRSGPTVSAEWFSELFFHIAIYHLYSVRNRRRAATESSDEKAMSLIPAAPESTTHGRPLAEGAHGHRYERERDERHRDGDPQATQRRAQPPRNCRVDGSIRSGCRAGSDLQEEPLDRPTPPAVHALTAETEPDSVAAALRSMFIGQGYAFGVFLEVQQPSGRQI